jgi:hypothetical protein
MHSAVIVGDDLTGGVILWVLAKDNGELFPASGSPHLTVEEAKADAEKTLKIRVSDWVAHEGEWKFSAALQRSRRDAINDYLEATKRVDEDGTR